MKICLCMAFAVVPLIPPVIHDKNSDENRIQGEWTVYSMTIDGKKVPAPDMTLIIEEDYLTFKYKSQIAATAFHLDSTKKPKTVDLRVNNATTTKTKTWIYKLEWDRLTLAVFDDAEAAKYGCPKTFNYTKNNPVTVFVFFRKK